MLKLPLFVMAAVVFATSALAQNGARIALQNLNSREVVTCYNNTQYSAEECAQYFEGQGYIRTKYIPYKPARFDYLTVDTFPARRWRSGEVTPRW